MGQFVVAILFVLKLASDRAVLNGNGVFSILMLSTKKRYPSFLKKVLFQICFLVPFFRRTYALSVGFKMETLRKRVFEC